MFDLVPFGRKSREWLDMFDKHFFDDFQGMHQFRTDIVDRGDHYELKADMPGFEKEDIHIEMNGDCLTIHAQSSNSAENKDKTYIRRERTYNQVSRSFDVSDVKTNEIRAQYKNGVLELVLPKKENTLQSEKRKIDIE